MSKENRSILNRTKKKIIIIVILTIIIGVFLSLVLIKLNDMENIDTLLETKKPALPSVLLDKNGKIITQFFSDEKRDIVDLSMVPSELVRGLIAWEDESFYNHHGFNLFSIGRATLNNFLKKPVSGASTITQQLSRTLFLTNEFSLNRKIKELFISVQLEKKYTKQEILSLYFNHVPFGQGINGVQAATKFFFNKDVNELTIAESASLITLISNPTFYSFIRYPKNHRQKQSEVLKKMVRVGIVSSEEADESFNEFWKNWRNTTYSTRGAFYSREDKAPFFSDMILNELEKDMPNLNLFKDGLTIYTTLDLDANSVAESLMKEVIDKQQKVFDKEQVNLYNTIQNNYIYTIGLLAETFSLTNIKIDNRSKNVSSGLTYYRKSINDPLLLTAQILGVTDIENLTDVTLEDGKDGAKMLSQVQGACIVLDNKTGKILTLMGGKAFDPNHRFNFATQSKRQPGSSFKPLVYSDALDTGIYNPATILIDKPYIFTFNSDDPDDWYRPENYGGIYYGKVSFRRALLKSLNIPACQIFYEIGKNNRYRSPIDRAAALMGVTSQKEINEKFKYEVSTVLGTGSVSPIEMAVAFSTFANGGKRNIPYSILKVEDRDGRIIYEPWREAEKRNKNQKLQVISPQNAFIITDILKGTTSNPEGLLYKYRNEIYTKYKEAIPADIAAKTGTTQYWSDGWVVGYSPEITVAMWVGFEKYGISLGYNQDGSMILGRAFIEYMHHYHKGKEKQTFTAPNGLYRLQVCRESGMLPSPQCSEKSLYLEYFLPVSVPNSECTVCSHNEDIKEKGVSEFLNIYEKSFDDTQFSSDIFDVDFAMLDSIFATTTTTTTTTTIHTVKDNSVDTTNDNTHATKVEPTQKEVSADIKEIPTESIQKIEIKSSENIEANDNSE